MGFTIRETASISEAFKSLIQSGNYERLILNIINASTKIFPNKYMHIANQSHSQCDFVDNLTSEKYDAKLLFTSTQGKLIGSNHSDFLAWVKTMIDETTEFGTYIENRGNYNIENLTLYSVMRDRLLSVEADEHAIFFIPYTIVLDSKEMIFTQFASDILSATFSKLAQNGLVGNRKVYAIYPSIDGDIVIRCLNSHAREFIPNIELKNYINFDVRLERE